MSEIVEILGRINGHEGESPGPASGITYTIGANMDGGAVTLDGQRPSMQRWPDTIGGEAFHVRAVPAGTMVPGWLDRSSLRVYWWFRELPDAGPCGEAPVGDAGNLIRIGPDGRPMTVPPPPPTGGFGAGNASGTPAGGGDGGGGGVD